MCIQNTNSKKEDLELSANIFLKYTSWFFYAYGYCTDIGEYCYQRTRACEPLASFTNFIWNDYECKILFIIRPFKIEFYRLKIHYFNRKHSVVTDGTMTLRASNQGLCNVWSCDLSHWTTAMSCDKCSKPTFLAYPTGIYVNPTGARKCRLTWGV